MAVMVREAARSRRQDQTPARPQTTVREVCLIGKPAGEAPGWHPNRRIKHGGRLYRIVDLQEPQPPDRMAAYAHLVIATS